MDEGSSSSNLASTDESADDDPTDTDDPEILFVISPTLTPSTPTLSPNPSLNHTISTESIPFQFTLSTSTLECSQCIDSQSTLDNSQCSLNTIDSNVTNSDNSTTGGKLASFFRRSIQTWSSVSSINSASSSNTSSSRLSNFKLKLQASIASAKASTSFRTFSSGNGGKIDEEKKNVENINQDLEDVPGGLRTTSRLQQLRRLLRVPSVVVDSDDTTVGTVSSTSVEDVLSDNVTSDDEMTAVPDRMTMLGQVDPALHKINEAGLIHHPGSSSLLSSFDLEASESSNTNTTCCLDSGSVFVEEKPSHVSETNLFQAYSTISCCATFTEQGCRVTAEETEKCAVKMLTNPKSSSSFGDCTNNSDEPECKRGKTSLTSFADVVQELRQQQSIQQQQERICDCCSATIATIPASNKTDTSDSVFYHSDSDRKASRREESVTHKELIGANKASKCLVNLEIPEEQTQTTSRKSPVTVQEWVDSLPVPVKPEDEGEYVNHDETEDNLGLGAEAGHFRVGHLTNATRSSKPLVVVEEIQSHKRPGRPQQLPLTSTPIFEAEPPTITTQTEAPKVTTKLPLTQIKQASFQSELSNATAISKSSQSSLSSVESLLEARRGDAEQILFDLGFGGNDDAEVARIPSRFLQASTVKGVDVLKFLEFQQEYGDLCDSGFSGYRGLAVPHGTEPSPFVRCILRTISNEKRLKHQSTTSSLSLSPASEFFSFSPIVSPTLSSNKFANLAKSVAHNVGFLQRIGKQNINISPTSVLNPENREYLEKQGKKSPNVKRRLVLGDKSFTIERNGELTEIDKRSVKTDTSILPMAIAVKPQSQHKKLLHKDSVLSFVSMSSESDSEVDEAKEELEKLFGNNKQSKYELDNAPFLDYFAENNNSNVSSDNALESSLLNRSSKSFRRSKSFLLKYTLSRQLSLSLEEDKHENDGNDSDSTEKFDFDEQLRNDMMTAIIRESFPLPADVPSVNENEEIRPSLSRRGSLHRQQCFEGNTENQQAVPLLKPDTDNEQRPESFEMEEIVVPEDDIPEIFVASPHREPEDENSNQLLRAASAQSDSSGFMDGENVENSTSNNSDGILRLKITANVFNSQESSGSEATTIRPSRRNSYNDEKLSLHSVTPPLEEIQEDFPTSVTVVDEDNYETLDDKANTMSELSTINSDPITISSDAPTMNSDPTTTNKESDDMTSLSFSHFSSEDYHSHQQDGHNSHYQPSPIVELQSDSESSNLVPIPVPTNDEQMCSKCSRSVSKEVKDNDVSLQNIHYKHLFELSNVLSERGFMLHLENEYQFACKPLVEQQKIETEAVQLALHAYQHDLQKEEALTSPWRQLAMCQLSPEIQQDFDCIQGIRQCIKSEVQFLSALLRTRIKDHPEDWRQRSSGIVCQMTTLLQQQHSLCRELETLTMKSAQELMTAYTEDNTQIEHTKNVLPLTN